MTYNVSSGTLYTTIPLAEVNLPVMMTMVMMIMIMMIMEW